MTDIVTDLAEIELAFGRKALLRHVEYDSGMTLTRLVLKEGHRITQVEMDSETAILLGEALIGAATRE